MESVKRLAVLTIALALAVGAAMPSVFAAAETVYPSDSFEPYLTFENLADFAIDGDKYAFAQNFNGESEILVYTREKDSEFGTLETLCENNYEIANLETEDGTYYYSDASGAVYKDEGIKLKDEDEYEFNRESRVNSGSYTYDLTDGTLSVVHFPDLDTKQFEGTYSKLKKYGESVYVIKENVLYSLNGTEESPVSTAFRYYNFDSTGKIEIGTSADKLKVHSLTLVKIEAGAYLTRVDLTDLNGAYFTAEITQKFSKTQYGVLLCTSDEAAIIGIKNHAYVTSRDKVTALSAEEASQLLTFETKCGYDDGATITGNRIYSKPFVSDGTTAADGEKVTGLKVSVIRQIDSEILGFTFFEVLYSYGGTTRTGYVAHGFLSPTLKEDTPPGAYPGEDNPDYSEKDNVTTVVIVLVLVVLVLAAVGYLTYIGTSDKRKNKKKQRNDDDDEDDED